MSSSALIKRVVEGKERIVLTRGGGKLAAVVPIEDFDLLEQLEDLLDVEEARRALSDPQNRERIPWEEVKAELLEWGN